MNRIDENVVIGSYADAFTKATKLIQIHQGGKLKVLTTTLEEDLDFNEYVEEVVIRLEQKYKSIKRYQTNQQFSFITGDTVAAVEVIKYASPYSVIIKEDDQSIEIPSSYDFQPWLGGRPNLEDELAKIEMPVPTKSGQEPIPESSSPDPSSSQQELSFWQEISRDPKKAATEKAEPKETSNTTGGTKADVAANNEESNKKS